MPWDLRTTPIVVVLVVLTFGACGGGDSDGTATTGSTAPPNTTTADSPSTTAVPVPTTVRATDARGRLRNRLTDELGDATLADEIVGALDDGAVATFVDLAGGNVETSPRLSYRPPTVAADDIDTLWVFTFGYRFAPGVDPATFESVVPPQDAIVPGPTNEELARIAAEFVAEHPVPVIAQAQVADLLTEMGVADVISVGPDVAPDGTVTYLSTAGATAKGLRLASAAGVDVGTAGILGHADHAMRCVLTARAGGLANAAVPEGVTLPAAYDTESGQPWTRSRAAYIPTDLAGRLLLGR